MARKLNLYADLVINRGEADHLTSYQISSYLSELGTPTLSIDFPNYRIVEGRVLIAGLSALNNQRITYIVDVDAASNFMRCYFVTTKYDRSGFAVFETTIDQWGTYYMLASFQNMHVTRCNKFLGEGVYDEVRNTQGKQELIQLKEKRDLTNAYVLVLLSFNVAQTLAGNQYITRTGLYAVSLVNIYNTIHAATGGAAWDNVSIIEKAALLIGGIHEWGSNKAHAIKMWVYPHPVPIVDVSAEALNGMHSYFPNLGNITIDSFYKTIPTIYHENVDIADLLDDMGLDILDYMPKYHLEFGTGYHTMPLTRYIKDLSVYFRYEINNTSFKVYVVQGLNEKEITEAYEVPITTNNMLDTATEAASRSIATTASALLTMAKGYASGGVAGAAVAGAGVGVGLLGRIRSPQANAAIGSGDGAANFTYQSDAANYVNDIYTLSFTASVEDEEENAMLRGANYDLYVNSIAVLVTSSYLLTKVRTGTFALIDAMEISGVDAEAENYIRSEFRRGIWLRDP